MKPILIVQERLGYWARQIRPHAVGWGFGLVESRSIEDLRSASEKSSCPIVLVDFRRSNEIRFEDLFIVRKTAPASLILVLSPNSFPGLSKILIEAGATTVLTASATPPDVLDLLYRWVGLARARLHADGWAFHCRVESEPWELLLAEVSGSTTSPVAV